MTSRKDTERLGAILIKANVIDELQLRSAMAKLGNWGGRLPRVLSELGFAEEDDVMQAIGKSIGQKVTHLGTVHKDSNALAKLDVKFCEEHTVFPISLRDRVMSLAMVDPSELDVIDAVKARCGARVQALLASETEIRHAILRHYHGQEPKIVSNRARRAVTRDVPTDADITMDNKMPPPVDRTKTGDGLRKASGTAFTQQDLQRLEGARANQSKTATILRAVKELLEEKGVMPKR
jgi:hypothetical protein